MKMDLRSKKGLRTDFDQLHSHSLPSSLFRVFFPLNTGERRRWHWRGRCWWRGRRFPLNDFFVNVSVKGSDTKILMGGAFDGSVCLEPVSNNCLNACFHNCPNAGVFCHRLDPSWCCRVCMLSCYWHWHRPKRHDVTDMMMCKDDVLLLGNYMMSLTLQPPRLLLPFPGLLWSHIVMIGRALNVANRQRSDWKLKFEIIVTDKVFNMSLT